MGVILYLVLYGQFPYMPSGEATAASMKDAIKRDYPPLCFQKSQAQNALSLVIPGLFGTRFSLSELWQLGVFKLFTICIDIVYFLCLDKEDT